MVWLHLRNHGVIIAGGLALGVIGALANQAYCGHRVYDGPSGYGEGYGYASRSGYAPGYGTYDRYYGR